MAEIAKPSTTFQNVEIYRDLVEELTRETPNESKVKKLMQQLGLKYSATRIDQLSAVLAFNPSVKNKGASNDL